MNALTAGAMLATTAISAGSLSDEGLIRICANHGNLIDAHNDSDEEAAEDDNPAWQAYERSRNAISEAQPQTLAGLLAKARAAKAEARTHDGGENPDSTPAELWAWDIVNDLLRLYGVPSPDAALIAACEEYLRCQRDFDAAYRAHEGDMEEGHPACAILDPVPVLADLEHLAAAGVP